MYLAIRADFSGVKVYDQLARGSKFWTPGHYISSKLSAKYTQKGKYLFYRHKIIFPYIGCNDLRLKLHFTDF